MEHGAAVTLAREVRAGRRPPIGNRRLPELAAAIFELQDALLHGAGARGSSPEPCASCLVTAQATMLPHLAPSSGGHTRQYMIGDCAGRLMRQVTLGEHRGGELVVAGIEHDVRYVPLAYDGSTQLCWSRPFVGERFSLTFFTSAADTLARRDAVQQPVIAAAPQCWFQEAEGKAATEIGALEIVELGDLSAVDARREEALADLFAVGQARLVVVVQGGLRRRRRVLVGVLHIGRWRG